MPSIYPLLRTIVFTYILVDARPGGGGIHGCNSDVNFDLRTVSVEVSVA